MTPPVPPDAVSLRVAWTCRAGADRVWRALVDWDLHSRWMVATHAQGGHGEGATVRAFTGVGRVGFHDPMEIVEWRPATSSSSGWCTVRHTGTVVRGYGRFEVVPLPGGRSQVRWTEWVVPPLGRVGRLAWPVARVPLAALLRHSLRRLDRLTRETG